jgi:hypothetical protein
MGWTPNHTILDDLAWPHKGSGESPRYRLPDRPPAKKESTSTPPTESPSTNDTNNRKEALPHYVPDAPPPYSRIVQPEAPRKKLCDVCENNNFLRSLHFPSEQTKYRFDPCTCNGPPPPRGLKKAVGKIKDRFGRHDGGSKSGKSA